METKSKVDLETILFTAYRLLAEDYNKKLPCVMELNKNEVCKDKDCIHCLLGMYVTKALNELVVSEDMYKELLSKYVNETKGVE